eukprot:359264-Chlamydomonas_euryale.AAC.9
MASGDLLWRTPIACGGCACCLSPVVTCERCFSPMDGICRLWRMPIACGGYVLTAKGWCRMWLHVDDACISCGGRRLLHVQDAACLRAWRSRQPRAWEDACFKRIHAGASMRACFKRIHPGASLRA